MYIDHYNTFVDSPIIIEGFDAKDCNSVEVEESIPDVGESDDDSRELTEDEYTCEAAVGEMILRNRHVSQGTLQSSQALTDTTDTTYYRVGVCSSC